MNSEDMADIHARAFAGQGRAWNSEEIALLLNDPQVTAASLPHGFALGRVVLDEAEVLTIATDPAAQRGGTGRALLQRLMKDAHQRGAQRVFLEVAEDNLPAISLYQSAGFRKVGRRKDYTRKPDGTRVDALVFERSLEGSRGTRRADQRKCDHGPGT